MDYEEFLKEFEEAELNADLGKFFLEIKVSLFFATVSVLDPWRDDPEVSTGDEEDGDDQTVEEEMTQVLL